MNQQLVVTLATLIWMLSASNTATYADTSKPPFIIALYYPGGWDQSLLFEHPTRRIGNIDYRPDPKVPSLDDFLTSNHQKFAVIKGVYFPAIDHHPKSNFMNSLPTKQGSRDWATYYSSQYGRGYLFPHLDFGDPRRSNNATLDDFTKLRLQVPIALQLSRTSSFDSLPPNPAKKIKELTERLRRHMSSNFEVNRTIGQRIARHVYTEESRFTEFSSDVLPVLTRFRTDGEFTFRDKLRTSIAAFKEKISYVSTLQVDRHWDDATGESGQVFERLFADLNFLSEQIELHALDRDVVVVVHSDSGISQVKPGLAGPLTTTRWPYSSVMLWGNMFASGVYGSTDHYGRGTLIRGNKPLDFRSVLSTLFYSQGTTEESFLREFPIFTPILR